MTRRAHSVILVMAVLVVACQQETVTTTTVPVAPPSTLGTTTTVTSVVEETAVSICGRGLPWDIGTTYVADCFVHPISFLPQDDGWVSSGATDTEVRLRWNDPADRDVSVRIAIIAYRINEAPTAVLETIIDVDGVSSVEGPDPVEVAGVTGIVVGLEGAPEADGFPHDPARDGCTSDSAVWLTNDQFGHGFFPMGSLIIGVGACDLVQAWIVDVDGLTLTLLAGTVDPADHQIAVDAAERLFASMSFGETP